MTANRAAMAFFGVMAAMFSMFVMLWVVLDDARIAAVIIVTAFGTLSMVSIGFSMAVVARRPERHQPEVVTADYRDTTPQPPQLPQPRYFQMSANTWTRNDRIDEQARRVAQAIRDADAQPTRDAMQTHGGIFGHEAQRAIVSKWVSWGWCTPPSQGKPTEWAND